MSEEIQEEVKKKIAYVRKPKEVLDVTSVYNQMQEVKNCVYNKTSDIHQEFIQFKEKCLREIQDQGDRVFELYVEKIVIEPTYWNECLDNFRKRLLSDLRTDAGQDLADLKNLEKSMRKSTWITAILFFVILFLILKFIF